MLDDNGVNEYVQLEPLCTNPNLPKYMRQLEPNNGDIKKGWDTFQLQDIFVCGPTNSDDQCKIAEKFEILAEWKNYVKEQNKYSYDESVCVMYFNLLYQCRTVWKVPFDLQFVEVGYIAVNDEDHVRCTVGDYSLFL